MRPGKHRDGRRDIGPDRHKPGVPQRELPGVAVDQIQTDRQDDVDADAEEDVQVVGIESRRNERNQRAGDESDQEQAFELHQTFSTSTEPNSPDGLNSRMKIRMANAMASR